MQRGGGGEGRGEGGGERDSRVHAHTHTHMSYRELFALANGRITKIVPHVIWEEEHQHSQSCVHVRACVRFCVRHACPCLRVCAWCVHGCSPPRLQGGVTLVLAPILALRQLRCIYLHARTHGEPWGALHPHAEKDAEACPRQTARRLQRTCRDEALRRKRLIQHPSSAPSSTLAPAPCVTAAAPRTTAGRKPRSAVCVCAHRRRRRPPPG